MSSVSAASALFSRLLQQHCAAGIAAAQATALQALLSDVWREGEVLPAAAEAEQASAAEGECTGEQQQQEQEQQQDQLEDSVGLPAGSCRLSKVHCCWLQLLSHLLVHGQVAAVLAVLDRVAAAAATLATGIAGQQQQQLVLPVSAAEGQELVQQALGTAAGAGSAAGDGSCAEGAQLAAVVGLLMPYRALQERAVEQLMQGQVLVPADGVWAQQLLVLLLLRGQFVHLAGRTGAEGLPGAGVTAAAAWQPVLQAYEMYKLLLSAAAREQQHQQPGAQSLGLVVGCLMPHAVAQLCLGSDYAAAAALTATRMRLASGLSTLQGALLVLERYLALVMHLAQQQQQQQQAGGMLPCCERWLGSTTAAAAHTAHTQLLRAWSAEGQTRGIGL